MAKSDLQKKTSKQVVKIKKKKWCTIVSPKYLGENPIGESYLEDAELAVGREVKVNLMQLSGDVKSQNIDVKFEITGATKEGRLGTRIIGYYFSASAIKRFIRRHMTRIDESLVVMTKDNLKVRIKPFLLSRSKISKSVEYAMRMTLVEEVINAVKSSPYETLFTSILKYQFQKDIKEKLNKIYPVKSLEIRVLEEEKNPLIKESPMPVKKAVKKVKSKKEKTEDMEEEEPKPSEDAPAGSEEETETKEDSE